jgi:hypothetical protein
MISVTVLPAGPNYSLHLAGENGFAGPNSNYESLDREGLIEKLKTLVGFSPDEVQEVLIRVEGLDRKYVDWHRGDIEVLLETSPISTV